MWVDCYGWFVFFVFWFLVRWGLLCYCIRLMFFSVVVIFLMFLVRNLLKFVLMRNVLV